jgi:hypothetical protein
MRTTLTLPDAVMRELRSLAAKEQISLKEAVHRVLLAGLSAIRRPGRRPRRSVHVFSMGRPVVGLDQALRLAGELEDEEVARKAELRK